MHLNNNKVGLAVGSLLGLWHLVWNVLIAAGLAQPFLNFVLMIHSLNNPFVVAPFGYKRAVALIVVTTVFGYVIGWVFAWLWNWLHPQAA